MTCSRLRCPLLPPLFPVFFFRGHDSVQRQCLLRVANIALCKQIPCALTTPTRKTYKSGFRWSNRCQSIVFFRRNYRRGLEEYCNGLNPYMSVGPEPARGGASECATLHGRSQQMTCLCAIILSVPFASRRNRFAPRLSATSRSGFLPCANPVYLFVSFPVCTGTLANREP
jgi:hypothetical protein